MTDFYSILKQSIVDRGLKTPAQREEVYGQARTAMIRKLWSFDPPLAEDEIDARIGTFDRAVERIEGDLVALFAGSKARSALRDTRQAAPARGTPEPVPYDDEADFVPAVPVAPTRAPAARTTLPQRAAPPPAPSLPSPPARRPRHDPLAEKSAAIEEALRGNFTEKGPEESDARDQADDEAGYGNTSRFERERDDEDFADEAGEDHDDGVRDRYDESDADEDATHDDAQRDEPAAERKSRAWRAPSPTAQWAGLAERTKVRALIGAIAALGIVLVVAGTYVVFSLLYSQPSEPVASPLPTPGGTTGTPAAATAIAAQAADVVQSYTLFDGNDPTVFESAPDNPVRFQKDEKNAGIARISSSAGSPGVRINIGPGIAGRLAGQAVRVVLVARAARENGAANMRFAYQSGVALSHWQGADLGAAEGSYGLIWRVPAIRTDQSGDYVLIEPGIPGDGTAVEIRSVRVDLLAKEPG